MTIIYPSPIFGPVRSRRLGLSLGINLLPGDGKHCTFDCVYCECGFNSDHIPTQPLPTREEVAAQLKARLMEMAERGERPDVLTFAGNGEPTSHPQFAEIIGDTLQLRDDWCPQAKVSVLSNATFIFRKKVFEALMKVDNNILKLDTVNEAYIKKVDKPAGIAYKVKKIVEKMKEFQGHIIIQTMFLKGMTDGENVDNTSDSYVQPWLEAVKEIKPSQVMIYTIDRETPAPHLEKASKEELDSIVQRVREMGIACSASY